MQGAGIGLAIHGVHRVANRFETIPVPYPAHVVMRGGRKEYPALLVAGASVRIASGPAPEILAELKMTGARPAQASMPMGEAPGWIGEPWRYYAHPETGHLLTEWRPSVWESNMTGGMHTQRGTMGLEEVMEHLRLALENDLTKETRCAMVGPAYSPFVSQVAWMGWFPNETPLVLPEGTEFRSTRVDPGVRDEALATAAKLARDFYLTEDGRLLVPTAPPRWLSGYGGNRDWLMPWPGKILVGIDRNEYWEDRTVPADRPDLAQPISGSSPTIRYGSISLARGYSPEPGLPGQILRDGVAKLVDGTEASHVLRLVQQAVLPSETSMPLRRMVEGIETARSEMQGWLDTPGGDPAMLIDPLARMRHRLDELVLALVELHHPDGVSFSDPRASARQSLRHFAITANSNEARTADRVLRTVAGITGLSLPPSCLELQDPDAQAAPGQDPAPPRPSPA